MGVKKSSNNKKEIDDYNNFSFSAIRGVQAGREYYSVMCQLKLVSKIFIFNESGLPPELRAQRTLNKARIPDMVNYIVNNLGDYTFSSITASIDGDVKFTPAENVGMNSRVGTLLVPMDSKFVVNDGQHRRAAIEKALELNPELGHETISVVFYIDRGLKRSQQMFADLNKNAVKPTTSLSIFYNHRDQFSRELISLMKKVPIFSGGLTEVEKTSISNRSNKVFTLNSLYNSTKDLLGKKGKTPEINSHEKNEAIEFWNEVYQHNKEWKEIVSEEMTPFHLRETYISGTGIILHSLGIMGNKLMKRYPKKWRVKLEGLDNINWRKNNPEWEGIAMINGRVSKSRDFLNKTSDFLSKAVGLEVD
jgi:DNA sulfur modification protein DndB